MLIDRDRRADVSWRDYLCVRIDAERDGIGGTLGWTRA